MQVIEAKLKENDSTVHLQTEANEPLPKANVSLTKGKEQLTAKSLDDEMSPMSLTIMDTRDPDEPSSNMVAGSNTIVGVGGVTTVTGNLISEVCEFAEIDRVPV
jgi:hypothetical protein